MKNKAREAFYILFCLNGLLLSWAFFFPQVKLDLFGRQLEVGFLSFNDIIYGDTTSTAATDSLIDKLLAEAAADSLKKDSILTITVSQIDSIEKANPYLIDTVINGISSLDHFFAALDSSKNAVHIAHYGDSQIEGDRISTNLRKKMQGQFGGAGLGYVPMIDVASHGSLNRSNSENWKRYSVFNSRAKTNKYGAHGTIFRFDSYNTEKLDSAQLEELKKSTNSATYHLKLAKWVAFSNVYLLYGNAKAHCIVEGYNDKQELVFTDSLPATDEFTMFRLGWPAGEKSIHLKLTAGISPDFYGFQVEGNGGVQVDNYGIRGHSGDGLMLIGSDYLKKQFRELNTKLVIFQYGANVVPYLDDDKECKRMEEAYYQLFVKYKQANPDASILVISSGDIATRNKGVEGTYPLLPSFVRAQRNAALRAGCAFWNLYESMGGENSILQWTKKKLASKDGHLSPSGQEIFATQLYNAIQLEYEVYKLRKKK
jgi:lysophospholipase L1-like esterase